MPYKDLPTNSLYPDDTHVIREVTIIRYIILDPDGKRLTRAAGQEFPDTYSANQWMYPGDTTERIEIKRYILIDKDNHKRSYWCTSKEQCEDYAVAYAPDKRPDFGEDEYQNA